MHVEEREQRLLKELQTIKTNAEWCEREQYKLGTEAGKFAAAHFAVLAMTAECALTENAEQIVAEKTGKLPAYCV